MNGPTAVRPGRTARTRSSSLILRAQDFSFLICVCDPSGLPYNPNRSILGIGTRHLLFRTWPTRAISKSAQNPPYHETFNGITSTCFQVVHQIQPVQQIQQATTQPQQQPQQGAPPQAHQQQQTPQQATQAQPQTAQQPESQETQTNATIALATTNALTTATLQGSLTATQATPLNTEGLFTADAFQILSAVQPQVVTLPVSPQSTVAQAVPVSLIQTSNGQQGLQYTGN